VAAIRSNKSKIRKKPKKPDVFFRFREPTTQAVELLGKLVRINKRHIVIESMAMWWNKQWVKVVKQKFRIPPELAKEVAASNLPAISPSSAW
jgi:hypothetical protein